MSETIGREFTYFKPYIERVDESDISAGYYVSSIVFQNDGSRWYRGIEFEAPESIDTLMFALAYAKQYAKWQPLLKDETTFVSAQRGTNSCKAVRKGDTWECEWCGTPHPLDSYERYQQGKPRFCMNCGAHFDEYEEASDD